MPSNHLLLCPPLLLPPSIFPSIRVFSSESGLRIRWPKYWSFSFNISPSNEHSGLISFRMDCLDPLESKGLLRVFSNTTVQKKRSSEWNILPQKSLPGSQAVQLGGHTFPWHSGMWSQVGLRKLHYEQSEWRWSKKAMAPHSSTLAWKTPWME